MKPAQNKNHAETESREMQILEFRVGETSYGMDVAIVCELLQYRPVEPMPQAMPCVEGVICPRNELLTVIELAAYLNHPASQRQEQDIFIIAEIGHTRIAFHAHQVVGMHQVPLDAVEKPDPTVFGGNAGVVTGVAKMNGNLISILDFDKIMTDVNPYACTGTDVPATLPA